MFRSSSLRLAAFYTVIFAVAVVALGVVTLLTTRAALGRQFDKRILFESAAMAREYQSEGLTGVVQAVRERDHAPGALDYGLVSPAGEVLAGRLILPKAPPGWSVGTVDEPGGHPERTRLYATTLPGGFRLLVGDDAERVEALDGVLLRGFEVAFLGVLVLGVAGGYGLGRGVQRRIASINGTAQAIIDGDLSRRVPVRGDDDELDHLAITLNRMLDRISGLMENLRQVSQDVAHDLRTPLTRLRQRLETSLADPGSVETTEAALEDLDAILGTFAALLRISQIEGGARRTAFRPTDLSKVARTVVEAFAPSAEDAGGSLSLETPGPLTIDGDPELLTQMLVNLVENALRHAGPGAAVRVRCATPAGVAAQGVQVSVIDNGPGVPASELTRVLNRFHRLESSRSTPGNGLGLALVAAVARLHGAELSLHDAEPGLEARIAFPR